MNDRERSQLVIALGEGQEGQRIRETLDRAAAAAGKPVGTWARETLLVAAGASPGDPIAEVRMNGSEMTTVALRSIVAMQGGGWSNKVRALIGGAWLDLGTSDPDELFARWKRLHRA